MKTIIDAVNELRADINNVAYIKSDETYHCNLNYNDDSGWWCGRGVYGDFVCTINDFGLKIIDMARHSPHNYFDYMMANKEPLTPPKTDKEKAIDDIYRSDLSVKENLAIAYDQWSNK
jgi:hypothetical protein